MTSAFTSVAKTSVERVGNHGRQHTVEDCDDCDCPSICTHGDVDIISV